MGATLELAFIGSFSVGYVAAAGCIVTGGILGVAFAINLRWGGNRAVIRFCSIATLALIVKISITGRFIPLLCHSRCLR